ncbi:hypothetical protein FF100_11090 [Methylobacterium terricola]|uniref:Phasin protein n=1 Tax=Methylobacterium terricola TaxID=2583531 RepID=A0A5C4LIB7_9HYPH|nr:hypothetical protein [Methylobacterium terricola]TNC13353.1 hypothetical protein FF100_11090 [Methylobacterium terricola]
MTTRRTDKTRKPPRRPAARPAARTVDSTRSGTIAAGQTLPDAAAAGTAATSELVETGLSETIPGTEAVSEQAPADAPVATAAEPFGSEPAVEAPDPETAQDVQGVQEDRVPTSEAAPEHELAAPDAAVQEAADQEPVARAAADMPVLAPDEAVIAESASDEPASEATAPAAVAASDDRAPAPQAEATPEQPAAPDRDEIPLAAMQGLIEINGRLVAFMQGEGQAAVAFWKAAMTVRSPGDLVQLQAAEMSRALDAALACWADLSRRMGRFAAFAPPRARAA